MNDETSRHTLENLRVEARAAVAEAMTAVRTTLDRLDFENQRMKLTIYGDVTLRQAGLIDRLDKIEGHMNTLGDKIDRLIDASQARDNQFVGARKAFYFLAAAITLVGGPPALVVVFRSFGVPL